MSEYTGQCMIGRRVFRDDRLAELDWLNPCGDEVDDELTVDFTGHPFGKLYLCAAHGRIVHNDLYDGLIVRGYSATVL